MQYRDFVAEVDAGSVRPVYVLQGEDDYWTGLALNKLCALAQSIDVSVYTPLDNADDALFALNSWPLMSDKRVVVLRDIVKFDEGVRGKLEDYCRNPADTSVLVMYRCGWAPKGVTPCVIDKVTPDKLADYVAARCDKAQMPYDGKALRLLVEYCEGDMDLIDRELDKLRAYCGGQKLDTAAVVNAVTPSVTYQIFGFCDKIASGQYVQAYTMLRELTRQGTDYAAFLGLLISHYRMAFYAKLCNKNYTDVAKALGKSPYAVRKAAATADRYKTIDLLTVLQEMYRLEYDYKRGATTPEQALELVVAQAIEKRRKV